MKRRNFLVGVGGTAIGGSALLGTGAFSRVESDRMVTIQVANDSDAYLGMKLLDTPNSNNFVDYDENGHLYIDIADQPSAGGEGVNSDSYTWFDGMFELCNQGKADATISYELPEGVVENDVDEQTVAFYYIEDGERVIVEEGQGVPLDLGECEEIGVRTVTKGIAADETPLINGMVTVTADAPGAGEEPEASNGT
ncbi:hypothetical protein ACLI4U_08950 [Natrialbaceae archaeon A-CW2]